MKEQRPPHEDASTYGSTSVARVEQIEKLLTPQQAADLLGVHISYIQNHTTRVKPLIPHVKLGGGRYGIRRFKPSQLKLFIDQQTTIPRKGGR